MRAIIYTRVSHDTAGGRSVEEQETESRRLCQDRDWTVTQVVTDTVGASRHSKGKRSGWQQATKLVEAGDVDVLVTWEASRAQRDLTAYAELRDLCVRTGTLWCYSGRLHDLSTSDDRFRTGIDALIAEREADETAARIQRAMRANAASGRPHGRRLLGYRRTYDPDTGTLTGQIPEPDEAAVVRRIYRDYLSGLGIHALRRALNEEGVTTQTGAQWDYTQIKRVLTNPSYAGLRVHQGKIAGPAVWEGLVSQDDFDQVQAILTERREQRRPRVHPKARLLTSVARCGLCGSKMMVGHDRKTRKVYICRDQFHISRDERKLDRYVTDQIIDRLEQPDAVESLTAAGDVEDPEVTTARAEVDVLRARLDDAVAQFTAGDLTGATLARIEADLTGRIADAERRLRRAIVPVTFEIPTVDIPGWWDDLEMQRRKEVVAALVAAVVIHPAAQKGSRVFDPSAVEVHWRHV